MDLTHERKLMTLLFNPFVYLAGSRALGLGLAAILGAGLLGWLGHTHFDGVLDTHSGAGAPPGLFLAEGLLDWLCLVLTLLIAARIVSGTAFRTLDLLGTQALARWPTLFIGLVTLPPAFQRFNHALRAQLTNPGGKIVFNTLDAAYFLAAVAAMLPLVCWTVALMYNSYSLSCNVKGGKAIGTFIAALILAEILSKIAIFALLKLA